jgi:hypothetical protein
MFFLDSPLIWEMHLNHLYIHREIAIRGSNLGEFLSFFWPSFQPQRLKDIGRGGEER